MSAEAAQVLAFRLARSGLAGPRAGTLAEAAACPASDFSRDAALLALGARVDGLSREAYLDAVETGRLAVAHAIRGAIHAVAPADLPLWGRALIASDDDELGPQLGRQVQRICAEHGIAPATALAEVADATADALGGVRRLDRNELHAELRSRVRAELMPWCEGCGSHHVAPMLWRYATVAAGVRLDSRRRYTAAGAGARTPRAAEPAEAVRRFLGFYGPAGPGDFAEWAGVARPHARRLWDAVAGELAEADVDGRPAWLRREDLDALASPPTAEGVRLLPPGDPFLQPPNRALLAPDPDLRKRLFRPVAGPGAVLRDGRLAGLWRLRLSGRRAQVAVEPLGRLRRGDLIDEAERVARLRGAERTELVLA